MSEKYAAAERPAQPPAEPLPLLSCDCHLHVFGDPAMFKDRNTSPVHPSREASWEDALHMHKAVGFQRGVFVQPANYTTDHSYLKYALSRVPRANYRATGIIDESVSDAELATLNEAGMRGVRFNFVRAFKMAPSPRTLQNSIERIRQYDWYVKIFIDADGWAEHIETFRQIGSIRLLIDHMGRIPPSHPARALVLDLLKRENVWVLLSNGQRQSAQASGWDDMVELGRAFYETAPDRCIFGTDWPHTHSQKEGGGPPEGKLVDLLYRYLPDAAARRAVLEDNAARLHGFNVPRFSAS